MTRAEVLEKAKAWGAAARPWAPYVGIVVLALVLVRGCNRERSATAELERLRQEAAARAAAVTVIEPVPDVRPALEAALKGNRELAAELERVRAAVPSARPTFVATAQTAPVPAGGSLVTCPAPAPRPGAPAGGGCVLRLEDPLQLRVATIGLEGDAGAKMLVGTTEAWRLATPDAPEAMLARAPWRAPLTVAVEKAEPANATGSRWGAGPWAGISERGALYGAQAGSAALRVPLLGWRLEANALGAAGPGGWLLGGGVLLRP